jgi:hypothetical protein
MEALRASITMSIIMMQCDFEGSDLCLNQFA